MSYPRQDAMRDSARFLALCDEADRLCELAEQEDDFDTSLELTKQALTLYERAGQEPDSS